MGGIWYELIPEQDLSQPDARGASVIAENSKMPGQAESPEAGTGTESVEFTYSKWAALTALLHVPVSGLVGLTFIYMALYLISSATAPGQWLGAFTLFSVGVLAVCRALLRFKYRYILKIRYVLESSGVSVEVDGAWRHFAWDQFSAAEYLPIFLLLRLRTVREPRPMVLYVTTKWFRDREWTQRNRRARESSLLTWVNAFQRVGFHESALMHAAAQVHQHKARQVDPARLDQSIP